MGNFYDILEVSIQASLDEIKKAYRRIAMRYHPDKNPNPQAVHQFNLVQTAYETLSDSVLKQQYDLWLLGSSQHEAAPIAQHEEQLQTVPIDPITGRKNYKYYRTTRKSSKTASDNQRVPYERIFKAEAGYNASRFWFLLIVFYTISIFGLLPLEKHLGPYQLVFSDVFLKFPLILHCITCLIDSYATPHTRVALLFSVHDYERHFESGAPRLGKILKFYIFQVAGLNTDHFTKSNSKLEALPFAEDCRAAPSQKFEFHYTPLLRYCFKITYQGQNQILQPDFNTLLIGNMNIYRLSCASIIFLCLSFYWLPAGLHNVGVLAIIIGLLVFLKKQSLTS